MIGLNSCPIIKIFYYVYANVPNLIHKAEVRNSSGPTIQFKDSACIYVLRWLCGGLTVGSIYEGGLVYEGVVKPTLQ